MIRKSFFRHGSARSRSGTLIIESVVAMVLLAAALAALGKLAATSAAIGRTADQRLSATLVGENLLEQLNATSFDDLFAESSEIANTLQESYGYEIDVKVNEFSAGAHDAKQIVVTVQPSPGVSVRLHDWRINPPPSSDAKNEGTDE